MRSTLVDISGPNHLVLGFAVLQPDGTGFRVYSGRYDAIRSDFPSLFLERLDRIAERHNPEFSRVIVRYNTNHLVRLLDLSFAREHNHF